mgnify:CR=1 FL=1
MLSSAHTLSFTFTCSLIASSESFALVIEFTVSTLAKILVQRDWLVNVARFWGWWTSIVTGAHVHVLVAESQASAVAVGGASAWSVDILWFVDVTLLWHQGRTAWLSLTISCFASSESLTLTVFIALVCSKSVEWLVDGALSFGSLSAHAETYAHIILAESLALAFSRAMALAETMWAHSLVNKAVADQHCGIVVLFKVDWCKELFVCWDQA